MATVVMQLLCIHQLTGLCRFNVAIWGYAEPMGPFYAHYGVKGKSAVNDQQM